MKRIHVLISVRLELKESTDAAASGIRSSEDGKSTISLNNSRVANTPKYCALWRREMALPQDHP